MFSLIPPGHFWRDKWTALSRPLSSRSPLGPVDPSFRALSGRLKFMVWRHMVNEDSLSVQQESWVPTRG